MKRILVAVVVLAAFAGDAHAQTAAQTRDALQMMQAQLDMLQAERDMRLGNPKMATYLDVALPAPWSGYMLAVGWAFKCGDVSLQPPPYNPRPARLDVLVDGLPVTPYFVTGSREDVRSVYAATCGAAGVPADPGVSALVDLSAYALGVHTLTFRLIDNTTGAAVYSNSQFVVR